MHKLILNFQLIYKALQVEFIRQKNADYADNNGMYIKRDKERIKRKALDLHDMLLFHRHHRHYSLHMQTCKQHANKARF